MDDQTLDRLLESTLSHAKEVNPSLIQKARQKAEKMQSNQETVQYYLPLLIAVSLNVILTVSLTLFLWWIIKDNIVRGIIGMGMSFVINMPFIAYLLIKEGSRQIENRKGGVK